MKIVVASTYIPFIRGGGTKIVDDLVAALAEAGHEVDAVRIPFRSDWPRIADQTLAIRLLDVTESCGNKVDQLITIRYPAYALSHPNKVAWFIHHHRGAYDLWGTPWSDIPDTLEGRWARDLMVRSDNHYLREARRIYTNSRVVADRLKMYNDITADGVLYPPLPRDHPFREGEPLDYMVYVSRLCPIKRQTLAIEAMRHRKGSFRLVLAGAADVPGYLEALHDLIRRFDVADRVELRGWVSEESKADLLAGSVAALYLPHNEDSYGYATLEAFHSGKPVITVRDSGGPLEAVEDGVNGLVAEPNPEALAEAMDRLWTDRARTAAMGKNAGRTVEALGITWDHVVGSLTQ
jgi:glycosyltransferase involved in cell wall biosynthesis